MPTIISKMYLPISLRYILLLMISRFAVILLNLEFLFKYANLAFLLYAKPAMVLREATRPVCNEGGSASRASLRRWSDSTAAGNQLRRSRGATPASSNA
jgi:hypothetical protein